MITLSVNESIITPQMKLDGNIDFKSLNYNLVPKTFQTPNELANFLLEGKTIVTSLLNGNKRNSGFKSTRIFCVDIDGGNIENFKEECLIYNIEYSFLYSTYSDNPAMKDERRFRAIFVYEDSIEKESDFKAIANVLIKKLFTNADTACSDSNRLFFGGTSLLDCKFDSVFTNDDIIGANIIHSNLHDDKGNTSRINKRLGNIKIDGIPDFRIIYTENGESVKNSQFDSSNSLKPLVKQKLESNIKEELLSNCKLLNEFSNASFSTNNGKIKHESLFHIFTNLIRWEGGKKWFDSMLDVLISKGIEPKNKKYSFNSSIPSVAKYPEGKHCSNSNCPFFSTCKRNGVNINQQVIQNKIIELPEERKPKMEYRELETTRKQLKELMLERFLNPKKRITVFKLDTGIGKTEAMINLPFELRKTACAFPNHALKEEVFSRILKTENMLPFQTIKRPTYREPFETELKKMESNATRQVTKYIKTLIDSTCINEDERTESNEYLVNLSVRQYKHFLFTTHEYAINGNLSNTKTIIFDEDPLDAMFKIQSVSTETIHNLIKSLEIFNKFPKTKEYLESVLEISTKKISQIKPVCSETEWNSFIISFQNIISTEEPIGHLFYSECQKRNGKEILFGRKNNLDLEKNIIVLSATANKQLYETLFENEVEFIDLSNVKTKGKVFLDQTKTLSRTSIRNMKIRRESFVALIKEMIQKHNLETVISFKTYQEDMNESGIPNCHFGALQGIDTFKGKNIGIFGTPYPNIEQVEMLNFLHTGKLLKNEKSSKTRIDYKEFNIELYLFENEFLKNVQLWLMEKEIIQAVGRARIINEDCSVYIFGVFPVSGATLLPRLTGKHKASILAPTQQTPTKGTPSHDYV